MGQLLDQAFQDSEVARDLLALVLRLAFEIGAHVLDLGMHLLEFLGELIETADVPGPLVHAVIAHRLIEALDAVGEEIEARHVVLDPVDALQVLVDDFERLFELAQAIATGSGPGGARDHEIGGRHDHVEGRGGDQGRNLRNAGMKHEPCREGGRRDRHGD